MTEKNSRFEEQREKVVYSPCLIVLAGLPLSGKSTIGKELANRTNIVFLDSDLARKEITQKESTYVYQGTFEQYIMRMTYTRNHEKARDELLSGNPVAVASTYSWEGYHNMVKWLAEYTKMPMRFFLLDPNLEKDEIDKRIDERIKKGALSNMRSYEHFLTVKNRYQVIEGVDLTRIDTTKPLEESVAQILKELEPFRI